MFGKIAFGSDKNKGGDGSVMDNYLINKSEDEFIDEIKVMLVKFNEVNCINVKEFDACRDALMNTKIK